MEFTDPEMDQFGEELEEITRFRELIVKSYEVRGTNVHAVTDVPQAIADELLASASASSSAAAASSVAAAVSSAEASKAAEEKAAKESAEDLKNLTSFEHGVHEVGADIPAGTYVSSRGVKDCYWARLTPGGDIIANNFISYALKGATVTVRKGEVFEVHENCGTWRKK